VFRKRLFESAETLIFDPVASNRNATRAALHALGFNKIELAASLEALDAFLKMNHPDLLLAELAGSEAALCDVVQSIRQGRLGANPFLVVIVTTWRRDGDLVAKVVNSGADDVVVRPFSTSQLGERIRAQIERRKPFVVTQEYSGPDRRRDSSRPGAECFEVPNTLRLRALDGLTDDQAEHKIREDLARGTEVVNAQRLRLDAVQLRAQWRLLEQREAGSRDFLAILSRLEAITKDMKLRAASRGDSVLGACDSIVASIQTALNARKSASDGSDFSPPLQLLRQSVLSLAQMFAPDEEFAAASPQRLAASRAQRPAA